MRIFPLRDTDIPITVKRMQRQEDLTMHSHACTEVVLVTGGSGYHATQTEKWPISSGDSFVINRTVTHSYSSTRNLELVNVIFDEARLAIPFRELSELPGYVALFTLEPAWRLRHDFRSRLRMSTSSLIKAEAVIDSLEKELLNRTPGFKVAATALLIQLITHLSRCYSEMTDTSSVSLLNIGTTISFMESNYDKMINLSHLASIAGMSTRSFQRCFRETIGTSPIDYLLKVRISRAAGLLRSGHFNVTEAAFETGFSDSNYFCRQFKRIVGTSPGKYRTGNAL